MADLDAGLRTTALGQLWMLWDVYSVMSWRIMRCWFMRRNMVIDQVAFFVWLLMISNVKELYSLYLFSNDTSLWVSVSEM
ncbi:hypothetical protein BJX99DRAFT_232329 [Aspergillus californicus]